MPKHSPNASQKTLQMTKNDKKNWMTLKVLKVSHYVQASQVEPRSGTGWWHSVGSCKPGHRHPVLWGSNRWLWHLSQKLPEGLDTAFSSSEKLNQNQRLHNLSSKRRFQKVGTTNNLKLKMILKHINQYQSYYWNHRTPNVRNWLSFTSVSKFLDSWCFLCLKARSPVAAAPRIPVLSSHNTCQLD